MRVWVTTMLASASLCLALIFTAQADEGVQMLELHCPDNSDPHITALCAALRERLVQDGTGVAGRDDDIVARLRGHRLKDAGLVAQLTIIRDGQRYVSPELMLTVLDRRGIPPNQLRRFADDLIARLALSKD